MKVILIQDVKALGKKGDLVEVNDGYAKNFLIPKKLCVEGTKNAVNERKHQLEKEARLRAEEKANALKMFEMIDGKTFVVKAKCGDGKMYGSVTPADIAATLAAAGYPADKKKITVKEQIKALGVFPVEVWCYKETVAKVNIHVVKDE